MVKRAEEAERVAVRQRIGRHRSSRIATLLRAQHVTADADVSETRLVQPDHGIPRSGDVGQPGQREGGSDLHDAILAGRPAAGARELQFLDCAGRR